MITRCLKPAFAIVALLLLFSGCGKENLSSADAASHIGSTRTIVGRVASADYFPQLKGGPTFLNLGQPYPHHDFTVVIWEEDRNKFSTPPELEFANRDIAVTGLIKEYKGKPEIVLRNPAHIEIQ